MQDGIHIWQLLNRVCINYLHISLFSMEFKVQECRQNTAVRVRGKDGIQQIKLCIIWGVKPGTREIRLVYS
jgi:hypothetical protein